MQFRKSTQFTIVVYFFFSTVHHAGFQNIQLYLSGKSLLLTVRRHFEDACLKYLCEFITVVKIVKQYNSQYDLDIQYTWKEEITDFALKLELCCQLVSLWECQKLKQPKTKE